MYDEIAPHFSETRHTPWPKVKHFVENLQPGSFLLDAGCGNGKYLNINKKLLEVILLLGSIDYFLISDG